MSKASNAIRRARTALVLDQPFFGVLALRLALREDPTCETAWVDGVTLGYNPDFIASLNLHQLVGLVAHEVMHCAAGHPWRRGGRDPKKWNVACDYAINGILADAGFDLPAGGLLDPAYHGKASEWIYDRLPDNDGGASGNDSQPQPGEVRDAPANATEEATESAWQQAVQQAAKAAQAQGKLPSGIQRFAAAAAQPKADWRSVLRRFVQNVARTDYTWRRPNVRYLYRGFYLPTLYADELGPIVVAIDTSGSVDDVLLAQFAAELHAIAGECSPARIHVAYADARLQHVDTFERGDPIELHPVGGGGTDFRPVFRWAETLDEQPACLVYLTDLAGTFPDEDPPFPVLWAVTDPESASWYTPPFGEIVGVE